MNTFILVCLFVLGYFRFSVSWILLAVFIYLFRQRQRTQFKQRHKMLNQIDANEEQYIKARLDELPSWVEICLRKRRLYIEFFFQVFFPDVERAEWVNRIIKQAWPYANRYLDQAVFHEVLIPLIRGTSPALADFSFEKLDLGEAVEVFFSWSQFVMIVVFSHHESEELKCTLIMCEIKS